MYGKAEVPAAETRMSVAERAAFNRIFSFEGIQKETRRNDGAAARDLARKQADRPKILPVKDMSMMLWHLGQITYSPNRRA